MQFCKGPELGTRSCDSNVVRTLVWLQYGEWEEEWEMRNNSFQINNEKLSVHLCLTCCPLLPHPFPSYVSACRVFLDVRNQVTENEVRVSAVLVHGIMQGSTVVFPQCFGKHPLLRLNRLLITAACDIPASLVLQCWGPVSPSGCVKAVTASAFAISMVPRQGDNLIRLFSASKREGE